MTEPQQVRTSTAQCIPFPTESFYNHNLCGPIQVSVIAANSLGSSRESSQVIEGVYFCHKTQNFALKFFLVFATTLRLWQILCIVSSSPCT